MIYYKNGKNHTLLNGYAVALFEYNCDTKQSNLLSKTYYNSKGTPVNNYKVAYYDEVWTDVIPDSVGEELLNKACELF